eukprot:1190683-Prymnesium_polylepis.1
MRRTRAHAVTKSARGGERQAVTQRQQTLPTHVPNICTAHDICASARACSLFVIRSERLHAVCGCGLRPACAPAGAGGQSRPPLTVTPASHAPAAARRPDRRPGVSHESVRSESPRPFPSESAARRGVRYGARTPGARRAYIGTLRTYTQYFHKVAFAPVGGE